MMKLTIGIPTYNRNELLNVALARLIDQVDSDVDIIICDNHSDIPVSESAAAVLDLLRQQGCGVKVVRNVVNIGGNCNLLNTLAQLQSGWMWMLGDDDEPVPDALQIIREEIDQCADDCVLLKLSQPLAPYIPQATEVYASMDDVVSRMTRVGHAWHCNMMFISTSVFRVDYLKPHFPLSFHFAYTCMPHVIICFLAVANGGTIRYSPRAIIDMDNSSKSASPVDYTPLRLGYCAMGEIPGLRFLSDAYRSALAEIECRYAVRHFVIGLCYEPENAKFWSSTSVRIGCSTGGVKGVFFVLMSLLQRGLAWVPFAPRAVRFMVERLGQKPKWISERC